MPMSTLTIPTPHIRPYCQGRVTQTFSESVTTITPKVTVTTGLFETHPHLLAKPARGAEPAWKREQHRRSAGRPR